jgi:hypothetical protein
MRNRLVGVITTVALLSGAYALPASASPPSTKPPANKPPATIGHSSTVTVQCDGSGEFTDNFTTDANALFGQETEVAAFNASPDPTTCRVV